ncbi:MAG: coniferyl-alcohol dehydrogenase [Pseudomonadales bacterium]|nr:coniferyl-alcohol dehydrogenase [Pseudomonadales bacterium]
MAGKTLVLTGASSGIGAAAAEILLAEGHKLISIDIQEPPPNASQHINCDMNDPAAIESAVAEIDGEIDGLLNVAGVPGTLSDQVVIGVNILGLRYLSDLLIPRLKSGGAVSNIASIAGFTWQRRLKEINEFLDTPDFATGLAWWNANKEALKIDPYSFSKECVVVLTMRQAGIALDRGARANSVSPGPVETPLLPDFKRQAGEEQLDWVISKTGRAAQPRDIAEVLCFLTTGPSTWMNGRDLIVDGGYSAGISAGWINTHDAPVRKRKRQP